MLKDPYYRGAVMIGSLCIDIDNDIIITVLNCEEMSSS